MQLLSSILDLPDARQQDLAEAIAEERDLRLSWSTASSRDVTLQLQLVRTADEAQRLWMIHWQSSASADAVEPATNTRLLPDDFEVAQHELEEWLVATPVTPNTLRAVVPGLLERVCTLYGADRATLWRLGEDRNELRSFASYDQCNRRHERGDVRTQTQFPHRFRDLCAESSYSIENIHSDPRVAAACRDYLAEHDVHATLDATLRCGGNCHGTRTIECQGKPRQWRTVEIRFAKTLAAQLAAAFESLALNETRSLVAEQQRTLDAMFEGSPIGIQIFDAQGVARRINRTMAQILDLPHAEADVGRYCLLEDPEMQKNGIDADFEQALEGQQVRIRRHCIGADGNRYGGAARRRSQMWLEGFLFPVRETGGEVDRVVAFVWDITDRVHAETQTKKLLADVRSDQRLDAVSRLAGGVAHDFNNILTAVRGFADLLGFGPADREEHDEIKRQLQTAAARGASLTKQLLTFGRRGKGHIERLDLSQIVAEAMPALRDGIDERIQLAHRSNGHAPIDADREHLHEVLTELVANASEAIRGNGRVDILIHVYEQTQPPYVELSVTDNGVGADSETIERMFEPFFTTKPDTVGLGLSLSKVYGIISELDGSISVDSEVGEGTRIRVKIPLALDGDDRVKMAAFRARDNETVMVVDDRSQERDETAQLLRLHGYRVLMASSAEAALELAIQHRDVDLVATEVIMPDVGGQLLAQKIVRILPSAAILYMGRFTSTDDPKSAPPATDQADREGAAEVPPRRNEPEVVLRPCQPRTFLRATRAALDNRAKRGASSTRHDSQQS
ncbi:MAG: ATP-binding protein [Planctomycetota bacterium]